jgi:hypothetical protein
MTDENCQEIKNDNESEIMNFQTTIDYSMLCRVDALQHKINQLERENHDLKNDIRQEIIMRQDLRDYCFDILHEHLRKLQEKVANMENYLVKLGEYRYGTTSG